ncbi:succinoglycan biosynthesis protein ExoW [Alkalispirillum mobile]|uniref:Succinoglycan biosynthesis protein ExoW n=1 Tax=Alkalispirillum mobile TaxID=85925 RepID=A0A498CE78_9GAMM|nr:glycosyltransferase family 2 protein [Alkalispirillum mobile]RLK51640.1 succinoglycan biosynthesis protein ExoW [Alkalispirillum mobile]
MTHHAPSIVVIIPYYQREHGLLRRAVTSVLDRGAHLPIRVVVVDDESPLPARDDIGDLVEASNGAVEILQQANAGPAAARNTALDYVCTDAPYVTFLDSDDQWIGPFLEDAYFALAQGYDLFIGNARRGARSGTRFEWSEDSASNIYPEHHVPIDRALEIYEFCGDFFDLMVRRTNLIGSGAIAYRMDRFSSLRFHSGLFQGEDRLFKLVLAKDLNAVAFSPKIYVEEGEGVNIFDKAEWGTPESLRLTSNYVRLSRMLLEELRLTQEQRRYLAGRQGQSRMAFAATLLHLILHKKEVNWLLVKETLASDPMAIRNIVFKAVQLAWRRFGSKGGSL